MADAAQQAALIAAMTNAVPWRLQAECGGEEAYAWTCARPRVALVVPDRAERETLATVVDAWWNAHPEATGTPEALIDLVDRLVAAVEERSDRVAEDGVASACEFGRRLPREEGAMTELRESVTALVQDWWRAHAEVRNGAYPMVSADALDDLIEALVTWGVKPPPNAGPGSPTVRTTGRLDAER